MFQAHEEHPKPNQDLARSCGAAFGGKHSQEDPSEEDKWRIGREIQGNQLPGNGGPDIGPHDNPDRTFEVH